MPRIAENADGLLSDVTGRLQRLVAAAHKEGRESALREVRALVGGGGGEIPVPLRRVPGRPRGSKNRPKIAAAKPKRRRRNPWAHMTPEQRAERVRKMLAGRGLKPKGDREA